MDRDIDKELLSHLLKLETAQQESVLVYIKKLLDTEEMNKRAEVSEQEISYGLVKSENEFKKDFENWKEERRKNIK
jgi:hypothetical protein